MTSAITFCSGIGGVDAGFVQAGIPVWGGYEFDPDKPQVSQAKKDLYNVNFWQHGSQLHLMSVQEAAAKGWEGAPKNPLWVHGSQPCDEFSLINVKGKESKTSIAIASAFVDGIANLSPHFFTLENVPGFVKSESFRLICQGLEERGYKFHYKVIPLLDCQNRQRLILLAGRDKPLEFPPDPKPVGWWEVVRSHRRLFTPCKLTERQKASEKIMNAIASYDCPLLIERYFPKIREAHVRLPWEQCWGLTDVWSDGKGGGRSNAINVWLDGQLWGLNVEAIAALQGFPSWYQFSPRWDINGSGIALSVPPKFIERLARYNRELLAGV